MKVKFNLFTYIFFINLPPSISIKNASNMIALLSLRSLVVKIRSVSVPIFNLYILLILSTNKLDFLHSESQVPSQEQHTYRSLPWLFPPFVLHAISSPSVFSICFFKFANPFLLHNFKPLSIESSLYSIGYLVASFHSPHTASLHVSSRSQHVSNLKPLMPTFFPLFGVVVHNTIAA